MIFIHFKNDSICVFYRTKNALMTSYIITNVMTLNCIFKKEHIEMCVVCFISQQNPLDEQCTFDAYTTFLV